LVKAAKGRIVREFVEEGVSGASGLSHRPALGNFFTAILQSVEAIPCPAGAAVADDDKKEAL